MKVNQKIFMAILLIGAISCASNNTVGVDQQQNVKYKEIDQQQQLANIRNEILKYNFTGDEILKYNFTDIDPNVFVMTIAHAKIGSLTNKLTQNKIIDDKLISAFQKAIVDSPMIDKIALDSSKIDVNTLNDQINSVHLSINRYLIKDAVNVINGGEYGALGMITDLAIALKLFEGSFVKLVEEDKYKEYTVLRDKIQELDVTCSKKIIEFRKNALIEMIVKQERETIELIKMLQLNKEFVQNDIEQSLTKIATKMNEMKNAIGNDKEFGNFLQQVTKLRNEIEVSCKKYREILEKIEVEEYYEKHLKDHAIIERISATVLFHIESLCKFENK